MPPVRTRECTEVYHAALAADQPIEFQERRVEPVNAFGQRVFRSDDRFDDETVMAALQELMKVKQREKQNERDQRKAARGHAQQPARPQTPSWREKVNRKRRLLKMCLQNQAQLNFKQVAKHTKSHFSTVKKVYEQLQLEGKIEEYNYQNLKIEEEVERLEDDIQLMQEGFMVITDLKRRHPGFSRQFIGKKLHDAGLKYMRLPKQRKEPQFAPPNSTRVRRMISHLCQGLHDQTTEVLFCDEVKFPLFQTSDRRWCRPEAVGDIVYNRRPVNDGMITAIALCSTKKFEAVQFYKKEVTGPDFLFFLNKAIAQLPAGRSYTILTDNATWHHAGVVERSEANKFLAFNEPRMFQINIIENAFSFVRHAFRKRPVVDSWEAEIREILNIFFDADNPARFKGLLRNHVRVLGHYFQRHLPVR